MLSATFLDSENGTFSQFIAHDWVVLDQSNLLIQGHEIAVEYFVLFTYGTSVQIRPHYRF